MPKIYDKVSPYHSLWRVIDDHWICVNDSEIHECLAEYLLNHGFDIPDCITYCLAENERFKLKFRQSGGLISVFISSNN